MWQPSTDQLNIITLIIPTFGVIYAIAKGAFFISDVIQGFRVARRQAQEDEEAYKAFLKMNNLNDIKYSDNPEGFLLTNDSVIAGKLRIEGNGRPTGRSRRFVRNNLGYRERGTMYRNASDCANLTECFDCGRAISTEDADTHIQDDMCYCSECWEKVDSEGGFELSQAAKAAIEECKVGGRAVKRQRIAQRTKTINSRKVG
jgi:hypothetical protein